MHCLHLNTVVIIYILSAVTVVLDLFTLNNIMLVKHRHIVLSLKKNCWYFETKSLHNHSHQRPSVKLKMHQNKSRLGLCPRPHWGSLEHCLTPLS